MNYYESFDCEISCEEFYTEEYFLEEIENDNE